MVKLLELPDALKNRRQHTLFDDFDYYIDADLWTATLTDTGTAAVGDAANGVITLTPSDGSVADNDEAYLESTKEVFQLAADKPLLFEANVYFAEANTDDANVIVGLKDAVGANTLVDDGAGPPADYDGAVFYKVDGETVWRVESSNGTAQTTSVTDETAGGAYQKLGIEVRPINSTTAEVLFYVDDRQVKDSSGNLIKHTVALASQTELQVCFGVKNGGANNQTLLIDYVCCTQLR